MKIEKEYYPNPINSEGIEVPSGLEDLIELLAKNAHDVWARNRLNDGWSWGPERCDKNKFHPCLIEYNDLPENEKNYDRDMAIETIKVVIALGFRLEKID